ncbi:TRAP transporter small permease subunit [Profundibacterium mesophilum]|uniref:TRAP transporter small permease protein n=1 Tax=Profundibacterium mesophilum KAUST100406-0324 TaxID=1037889 RepID=A0A921NRR0_9RHOB|nr:TRAP transporter small permease [Profundibacterium mesophilum]KAF0675139.1 TRAP dicarboxylate transporter DctQ subunit [Profundibacterium mesophilum KAUST100406-0324]
MAAGSSVIEDHTALSRLDRKLARLEKVMAFLSGLAVFGIMLLAVVSVTGRNGFNSPLPGYVDWIEQLMPLIAFLGLAYTQRDGTHIRMDIFVSRLRGRMLWAIEWITTLITLAVVLLLIWGSWSHFGRSFDLDAPLWSRDSSIDIAIPLWPTKLLVPVAFSVLAARLAVQLWGFGRAFMQNAVVPVAVPLVKSAAELAAEEADLLADDT